MSEKIVRIATLDEIAELAMPNQVKKYSNNQIKEFKKTIIEFFPDLREITHFILYNPGIVSGFKGIIWGDKGRSSNNDIGYLVNTYTSEYKEKPFTVLSFSQVYNAFFSQFTGKGFEVIKTEMHKEDSVMLGGGEDKTAYFGSSDDGSENSS